MNKTCDLQTTQDSTHYSTAPFSWITDSQLLSHESNNLTPGLFIRNNNPLDSQIDKESSLVGLGNLIGKCERVDVNALNKAKELSSGLQKVYDVSHSQNVKGQQHFLNPTRLTQPDQSVSELNYDRFVHLPYNPQALNNIIEDDSFGNRGGNWSRNTFKDNYTCPVTETRGNNQ